VLTLGDELALVGFPGDAFDELGLNIKLNSPFPFTIVNEQSGNGTLSYVPNRKAFPEGAYEVISARFAPGGGEILADAALRILIDMHSHQSDSLK
jgi:neutral ceramidase